MFYLLGGLLCLLAAVFACWPMLRRERNTQAQTQHERVVRDLYRSRIAELRSETEDAALREEIETELGAVLLSEAAGAAEPVVAEARPVLGAWIIAALVPVVGLLVYGLVADPALERIRGAETVLELSAEQDQAELESWVLRLAERTADVPDDSKSWYLLGHALLKRGRFADAAEAFATTDKLVSNDLNVQISWLQARYLAADAQLDQASLGLAERILEQQPDVPVVLEMLALDAFRKGSPEQAISLLNRGLAGATDLRRQASFALAIARVREDLTDPPPGVSVSVSAEGDVPPHASIFVIARPPGGGMPYAVVKRPAFLLPFAVRLDDLVGMSPGRRLTDAEVFEVVVRLSASGVAMASQGDWQWQSEPLNASAIGDTALDATLTPPE